MNDKNLEPLSRLIKEWIRQSHGWFWYSKLDSDLKIESAEAKQLRRVVVKGLFDSGEVERDPKVDGRYRRIDSELLEINWQGADATAVVPLKFPFQLEDYVKIFPKSIMVVAGTSNAGKTALLYNIVIMNMNNLVIDLYNSETNADQMKERFDNFEIEIPNPAPFRSFERYDNFADVIDPDHISVIDYLDFNSEVYEVGEELERMFRKLRSGVVITAIQKKASWITSKGQEVKTELGYGGTFSVKKSSLYLSMDPNRLKIVKAKSWRDSTFNPNGLEWTFNLIKGAKFVNIFRQ